LKILLLHNFYLQPGGEDQVFAAETDVLRAHGEDVRVYTVHNTRIASMSKFAAASATVWNREIFDELTGLLHEFAPDIVHCHNTFPLISPAAYAAAGQFGIPVVQTLHNFRLLCLNGLFLRNGARCEDCMGRAVPWPGVLHGCYRESRPASAVVAAMVGIHRRRRTWQTAVDTYIAMSEFARAKFIAGGLPADRIVVKPNFLAQDPGTGTHSGAFALYVGRLSPEKGIAPLVRLWGKLETGVPLRVIGSGPLETLAAEHLPGVEWLGWQSRDQVLQAMKEASFLLFPTECYEGFPVVLLEAMATGLPVLASQQGSLPDIIEDGVTGVLVPPGSPEHWANAIRRALAHPDQLTAMGQQARRVFEGNYTPDAGYRRLVEVYGRILERTAALTRS
jgi:glycosyltransferase involved in cell wall biosynthesis